ncbi:dentin sialophosphoprotein isoform X1 [Kryptolebias marmoratus]|uniref:dentin sialophosphoprotein isoform X1 n=1 Tax=Kryptolebias marmoratus TaxID=37003 RepID=UPI0018ACB7B7|nr:dentin sialophosphoprotein isoform X1 [Kryptolebias marmoratus]
MPANNKPSADEYHGLNNRGATCYLNSVLQVLFMTEEFREAVKSFSDDSPDTEKVIDPHLKDLFHDLQRETTHTKKIIKALKIDRVYEQRDAAEYLEKILSQTSSKAAEIFHGQMVHRTTCSVCETDTETGGQFWHLPFDLVDSSSGNYSVEDGIEKHFKPSYFNGDNQMYCDKCDTKVDASSKYVIKHHPDVLILLLKRFDFSYHFMSYVKIKCDVDVPHTLKIPENQTYELYAVVDHFGDLRGGHYTATIKSQDDEDRWFSFDDTRVTSFFVCLFFPQLSSPFTDDKNVAKFGSAYLLFYRKKADIQEKRKRKRNEIRDDLVPKKAKLDFCARYNTVKDTDIEDQEDNKNLLSTEIWKRLKVPEREELTVTRESRPDADHDVQPGESKISAVLPRHDRHDDMSDPPGGFIDEETEIKRIKNETENSDRHENMTSKDADQEENTDENDMRQEEDTYLISSKEMKKISVPEQSELTVVNQTRPDVCHDFKPGNNEKVVSAAHDRQDDISHAQGKLSSGTTEDKQEEQEVKHETEDFSCCKGGITSKDRTTKDLEDNRGLPSTGDQTELKDPDEADINLTTPDVKINLKPGDSERSPLPAGHDEMSPEHRKIICVTTDVSKETKNSNDHEQVMKTKDEITDDWEENRNLLSNTISAQTEVKNPEKSEQTETKEMRPFVDHDVQPRNSKISAVLPVHDRQDDVSDPYSLIMNVTTDKNKQTENSDSHEDMTSKDTDQDKDRGLPSTGDQTELEDQDEAELTEVDPTRPGVGHDFKPGDSEKVVYTIYDRSDDISDAQGRISDGTTDNTQEEQGVIHETENFSSYTESIKSKDRNTKDLEDNRGLPSTGDQTEVKDPDEAEINLMTPDVKINVKPGDSERSPLPAGHDEVSPEHRKRISVTTDERKQTENSDSHEQVMKSKGENTDDREENRNLLSTEVSTQTEDKNPEKSEQTETKEMRPDVDHHVQPGNISAVSAGHDRQNNTSGPPGRFIDEKTKEKGIKHETENSDIHADEITSINTDTDDLEEKISTEDQDKIRDPENKKLKEMRQPLSELTDKDTKDMRITHETENSDSHEDMTSKDADQETVRGLPSTGDQTELQDQDEAELTDTDQMTPDVKINLKPEGSERSPLPAGHDEVSPEHRKIISVTIDESKQTESTHNYDNNEQEMTTMDENTDDQEETVICFLPPFLLRLMPSILTNWNKLRSPRQNQVLVVMPENSEISAVSGGHGNQDDMSDPHQLIMNIPTNKNKQTENSDSHEDMTLKDTDQDKDRGLPSTGDQTELKDPDEAELTVVDQTRPNVSHDFKPGDSETGVSADHDRQEDISEGRLSDGTTDNTQGEKEVKHETENFSCCKEGITCKDGNTKDLKDNRGLPSTGDQTYMKDPDEAEINLTTPDEKINLKPEDSERSPLPAGHDEVSHEHRKIISVTIDESKQTETTQNFDNHEQEMTTKDENTDDQEETETCSPLQFLLRLTSRFLTNLKTSSGSHEDMISKDGDQEKDQKPNADHNVKPGNSEVSAVSAGHDGQDDMSDPAGKFINKEGEEKGIKHEFEN